MILVTGGTSTIGKHLKEFFPDAKYSLDPSDGLLVLFPSWLKHFVPSQTSNYERVSIAGDIMPHAH